MSLIEVVVAMGMLGIMSLALISMMDNQNKETKSISEKIDLNELHGKLSVLFDDPSFCGCFFNGKTFNTVTKSWNQPFQSIPEGYLNTPTNCTASLDKVIPTVGLNIRNSHMKTKSIQVSNNLEFLENQGKYTAELIIEIDNLIRIKKPIKKNIAFSVDTNFGSANSRPFMSCLSSEISKNTVHGFCTPRNDWDNSNTTGCPDKSGYTKVRLTGVGKSTTPWHRAVSCCYMPLSAGGNGWCSDAYPTWDGSGSGCGASNAYYSSTRINGIVSGNYDNSICCFVPKTKPIDPRSFSSIIHLDAADHWSGCGGPYTHFEVIELNTVLGGTARNGSCTYVPK